MLIFDLFVFLTGSYWLVASLVGLIVVSAYKSALLKDSPDTFDHIDYMWRLLIGLGCVPGAIALYFRLTIPETPRFTMDIERNVVQASKDVDTFLTSGTYYVDPDAVSQRVQAPKASGRDFRAHFGKWANFKVLFAASYAWFALDVSVVGLCTLHSLLTGIITRLLSMVLVSTRPSCFRLLGLRAPKQRVPLGRTSH